MAGLADLKIAEGDYTGHDVAGMPDSPSTATPAWTVASIKAQFDMLVKEIVADRFNDLVDALASDGSEDDSGSEKIGSKAITGVVDEEESPCLTVYDQLVAIKAIADNAVAGELTNDLITDAMLKDSGGIKANFAAHIMNYLLHVGNAGTTGGTTSAYTATITGFSTSALQFFIMAPHVACAANATLAINGGTARQIVSTGGANVTAGQMMAGGIYILLYHTGGTKFYLLNPEQTLPHAIADVTGLQAALEGKAASSHTQSISTVIGLTDALASKAPVAGGLAGSRALTSDASGNVSASTATSTELGYLNNVTSAIQTQLDAKFAKESIIYQSGTPTVVNGAVWLKPIS